MLEFIRKSSYEEWKILQLRAYRAAMDYNLSEESWRAFWEAAIAADEYLHGQDPSANTAALEEHWSRPTIITEQFGEAAKEIVRLGNSEVQGPSLPTLSQILEIAQVRATEIMGETQALDSLAKLNAYLEKLHGLGAVIQPVHAYLVAPQQGKALPQGGGDGEFEGISFRPKIMTLIDALEKTGIYPEDMRIVNGMFHSRHMRKTPYIVISIPRLNVQIAITDQYGQITYVANPPIDENLWWDLDKEELDKHPDITGQKYSEDGKWIEQILEKIGVIKDGKILDRGQTKANFPAKKLAKTGSPALGENYLQQLINWEIARTGRLPQATSKTDGKSVPNPVFVPECDASGIPIRDDDGKIKWIETADNWRAIDGAIAEKQRGTAAWLEEFAEPPECHKNWSLPLVLENLGYEKDNNLSFDRLTKLIDWEIERTGNLPQATSKIGVKYVPNPVFVPECDAAGNPIRGADAKIKWIKTKDNWNAINEVIMQKMRGTAAWLEEFGDPPDGRANWTLPLVLIKLSYKEDVNKDISLDTLTQLINWEIARTGRLPQATSKTDGKSVPNPVFVPESDENGNPIKGADGEINWIKTKDNWAAIDAAIRLKQRGTAAWLEEFGDPPDGRENWSLPLVLKRLIEDGAIVLPAAAASDALPHTPTIRQAVNRGRDLKNG